MKPLLLVVCVLVFVGGAVGCCTPHQKFVGSMENAADFLLPDLKKYYQNDPNLDEDQKKRRIRLIEEWRWNIESAKETGMLELPGRAGL